MSKRNHQLEKHVKALVEEVARLRQENLRLKARVSELEERLGQNSRNTSKPPSSDPPSLSPPPQKPGSGRNPGGQPGHKGHQRELVPEADVDEIIPVKPTQCRDCGAALRGEDPAPRRHQVADIPQIKPSITEYQLHALCCYRCNAVTTAGLPAGVPSGAFGPRAVATVSLLTSFYRLGRRSAAEAMLDLFGLRMSLGSVPAGEQIASAALAEPVSEAQDHVKEQSVKQADETSWFEGVSRKRAWLWVAFTEQVTVFLIRASRGTDIAKELLGQTFGVLVTDRWCALRGGRSGADSFVGRISSDTSRPLSTRVAKPDASEKPFSWRRSFSLSGGIEFETARWRAQRYELTRLRCGDG